MLTPDQEFEVSLKADNPRLQQRLREAFERQNDAEAERLETMAREGATHCGECRVLASYSYPCPCRGRC